MATKPYEVEYEDGRVRVKMLSPDGAEQFARQGDVADVRLPDDAPEDASDELDGEPEDEVDGDEGDEGEPEAKQAPTRRNKSRTPAANK